jgi:Zn-finger protein
MEPKTKEKIALHIERILDSFSFLNRSKIAKVECPCYEANKPCHDLSQDEFNCFLCYCPEYDNSLVEGGCKINRKEGKWFYPCSLKSGKIWDCSDCTYPHKPQVVRSYLEKFLSKE